MYETTFRLPSAGKIQGVPESLTIRNLTTEEEKKLFAVPGPNVFDKVLDSCIVSPEGFSTKKMIVQDKMAYLLHLRAHTYGPNYRVFYRCPSCGEKFDSEVNLLEFPFYELEEDFEEKILIELPQSKDVLEVKFLTGEDIERAEKLAKSYTRKFKQSAREAEYVYRMVLHTISVNGVPFDSVELGREYFTKMSGMDSAEFWAALNKRDIGYDTTMEVVCPYCSESWEEGLPVTIEFFRPGILNTRRG